MDTITHQLFGQYARLHREWQDARAMPGWSAGRIERLSNAIVETGRQLADLQPVDEQTGDSLPVPFLS